jgi:putative hydrolase of the HAD superfamily
MPIQTVFFDMGGTIETFWYSPEMRLQATSGLQELLLSHGIDLQIPVKRLYDLVTGGIARYHQWRLKTLDELPVFLIWCNYILHDYPGKFKQLEPIADELMVWIEIHYYERLMRPEIPSVLDEIQKMGCKIGLISNVSSRGQVPHNLKQYGIYDYFKPIVLSSEYGRRKPDPSIFHYAARLSNTPTSECIYIGDRISRDVVGAKRAGYKLAIQIRHDFNHGESDEGATPDSVLNNMTGLLDILHSERKQVGQKIMHTRSDDNRIRAVLFDAAGVLYNRAENGEELTWILNKMGLEVENVPVSKISHYRTLASIGKISYEEYKTSVLQLYGLSDPKLISRGIELALADSNNIRYFDGAYDTLRALKNRGLYLGIVTDTAQPLHVKLGKLERGGIGNLWDAVISSQEVGFHKPQPQIYHLALKQLGLRPDQAIFVGHKTSELKGARNVGLKTVAFNHDQDARADYYIDKLTDLLDLPFLKASADHIPG